MGFDIVVALTGVSLVFLILVLLMLIITVEGKAFDGIAKRKADKAAEDKAKNSAKFEAEKAAASVAEQPAPVVEAGISGEIVAAIAAAIAMLSGGKYTLRTVRRAGRGGASSWSNAGNSDATAPF